MSRQTPRRGRQQGQATETSRQRHRSPTPASGRRGRARVRGLLVGVAALTLLSTAWAQPAGRRAAAARPARPAHAPLFGARPALPPLPPEYLTHERAGVRFAYHPSARDRVRPLIESAERERHALRSELNQPVLGTVDVRVAMTEADFGRIMPRPPQTETGAAKTGMPDEPSRRTASADPAASKRSTKRAGKLTSRTWRASGSMPIVAFAELSLLVMNLGGEANAEPPDPSEAFRHGLAHLALDEATGSQVVPRWFHEGYATRFADETSWSRASALGWASVRRKLAPMHDLDWYLSDAARPDALSEAQAADFVGYLLRADRAGTFSHLVLKLKSGEPYSQALRSTYGADERRLERAWQRNVAWRTVFVPVLVGGMLIALLGALAWRLRVRQRARREHEQRQLARTRPARRSQPTKTAAVQQVTVIKVEGSSKNKPPKDVPLGEPQDPGVPKVSHDGRWHTLH